MACNERKHAAICIFALAEDFRVPMGIGRTASCHRYSLFHDSATVVDLPWAIHTDGVWGRYEVYQWEPLGPPYRR